MARHDRLIAFLEKEAAALRDHIAGLKQRDVSIGTITGDRESSPGESERLDAEARLREIEGHLRDLRRADAYEAQT
jgi:hypothetical protein